MGLFSWELHRHSPVEFPRDFSHGLSTGLLSWRYCHESPMEAGFRKTDKRFGCICVPLLSLAAVGTVFSIIAVVSSVRGVGVTDAMSSSLATADKAAATERLLCTTLKHNAPGPTPNPNKTNNKKQPVSFGPNVVP